MIPFEFRHHLWRQKTRVMGLSCGIICVILCLAVLMQYWSVTDRHTDTHRHTTTAYIALSIASRGKKNYVINFDACIFPITAGLTSSCGTVQKNGYRCSNHFSKTICLEQCTATTACVHACVAISFTTLLLASKIEMHN